MSDRSRSGAAAHAPHAAFAAERQIDLNDRQALVVGAGSLGGFAAWSLASRGIGRLVLVDRDSLSRDNVRRHVCPHNDVGTAKTKALAAQLRARFPNLLVVDVPPFCCLDEPHTIRRELEAADIVLVAVDDEAPKYLIDAMAWELQRPVVYGGVYGGGWGAEVVLVDPIAATPCYGCAASVLGRTGVKLGKNNLIPSYALPNAGQDEDGWTLADLTSIKPAATLLSNVAIAWLEADAGHPARLDELQQDASTAWRFAFRHVPVWNLGPWCLQPVAVNPKPDCPQVCGLPGVIPIKHVCGDANLLVIAADGCELQRKAAG